MLGSFLTFYIDLNKLTSKVFDYSVIASISMTVPSKTVQIIYLGQCSLESINLSVYIEKVRKAEIYRLIVTEGEIQICKIQSWKDS